MGKTGNIRNKLKFEAETILIAPKGNKLLYGVLKCKRHIYILQKTLL
jgi:hypothetical protein